MPVFATTSKRVKSAIRVERLRLATITDLATGFLVGQRRSQEVVAQPISYSFVASHAARFLHPGQAFFYEGIPELLRIVSIQPEQFSGRVKIEAQADFYGLDQSTFALTSGGSDPAEVTAPVADEAQALLEVPAYLVGGTMVASVLRLRASSEMRFADIHLSRDGTTYNRITSEFYSASGGELTSALSLGDDYYIAQGPTFDVLGPDISNVVDLSDAADEERWRLGEQLALIGSELFSVRKVTALTATSYRLDGLLRARYRTARAAHSIGAKVFVFKPADVFPIEDPLLQPQKNLYVKAQPVSNTALSLASVTALTKLPLYGLGVRPEPVGNLRAVAPYPSPSYSSGDDVTTRWCWAAITSSPYSGYGLSDYNGPNTESPLVGSFTLEIRTLADAVVRTVAGLASAEYTYTNANLVSDLGSEVGFKVVVRHVLGGFLSSDVELTIGAP